MSLLALLLTAIRPWFESQQGLFCGNFTRSTLSCVAFLQGLCFCPQMHGVDWRFQTVPRSECVAPQHTGRSVSGLAPATPRLPKAFSGFWKRMDGGKIGILRSGNCRICCVLFFKHKIFELY